MVGTRLRWWFGLTDRAAEISLVAQLLSAVESTLALFSLLDYGYGDAELLVPGRCSRRATEDARGNCAAVPVINIHHVGLTRE